jgi:hypothetical protein
MIFYLLYALLLFAILLYLSRLFLDGKFSLEQWIPVLATGVILLNPRIIEYDFAPLTLLMALILWRTISSVTSFARAILYCLLFFAAAIVIAILLSANDSSYINLARLQGFLLAGAFIAGCWNLLRQARHPAQAAAPLPTRT